MFGGRAKLITVEGFTIVRLVEALNCAQMSKKDVVSETLSVIFLIYNKNSFQTVTM